MDCLTVAVMYFYCTRRAVNDVTVLPPITDKPRSYFVVIYVTCILNIYCTSIIEFGIGTNSCSSLCHAKIF